MSNASPSDGHWPDPIQRIDTAFFWEACERGELVAQKCPSCDVLWHPPRPICPTCHSTEKEVQKLSGKGQLQSLATLHQKVHFAELRNADYRDSWAWVHFMLHRSAQTRELLLRYLTEHRAHSKHVATDQSSNDQPTTVFDLQRALLDEIPDLRQQLREHFTAVAKAGRIASDSAQKLSPTIATFQPN